MPSSSLPTSHLFHPQAFYLDTQDSLISVKSYRSESHMHSVSVSGMNYTAQDVLLSIQYSTRLQCSTLFLHYNKGMMLEVLLGLLLKVTIMFLRLASALASDHWELVSAAEITTECVFVHMHLKTLKENKYLCSRNVLSVKMSLYCIPCWICPLAWKPNC